MILANAEPDGNDVMAEPHMLPASHLTFTDSQAVYNYLNNTENPVASMSPIQTEIGIEPNPVMADFSSRGPCSIEPSILKPDITAPGVDVIAAFTQAAAPTPLEFDNRRVPFTAMSGTSMSGPHVAGIVGLLKAIHPDWSPAAIKSAIMTTAKTRANNRKPILDEKGNLATPFAYGAGHVDPKYAADPGLVYDLTVDEYLNFLCSHGYTPREMQAFSEGTYVCPKNFSLADFNYPSITVLNIKTPVAVTRRLKNVGPPSTYRARVKAPAAVSAVVEPATLTFTKTGEEQTFKVAFKPNEMINSYIFGQLTWSDGVHFVRSPLVMKG
uniref:Subtilisin-like protease SBT5.4 n=1 Tax=Rhizophora mucronata TaxID=61149 RepID=A0A2P2IQP8_RHIMU